MKPNKHLFAMLSLVAMVAFFARAQAQTITPTAGIVYVTQNGAGTKDGSSWANALAEVADALKTAISNPAIQQIWVAKGTYKPKYSPANNNFGTNYGRNNSFLLVEGVKLYGGFAGNETTLAQRVSSLIATTNKTILSGDLNSNDGANFANNDDNAYHVVLSVGTSANPITNNTLMDGFTITGGNANGGGYIITINGITISRYSSGGMVNYYSSPTLTNVTLSGNSAYYGGGMFNVNSSSPTLTNVALLGNKANDGGGMYNNSSSPTLTNVTLSGNSAYYGGGMYNSSSSKPKLYNTILLGNNSGIYNYDANSLPEYKNSLVQTGNVTSGGIFYDNAGTAAAVSNSAPADMFVNPQAPGLSTAGDYALKSTAAAAIDKGNNQLLWDVIGNGGTMPPVGDTAWGVDLAGNPRINNGTVDLGAYEMQCNVPAPTAASPQNFSNGATVADLAATAQAGNTLKWYTAATGGAELPVTTALVNGETYYVSQVETGGCESDRTAVSVTVGPTTGLDNLQEEIFRLYPNPVTNGIFTIETAQAGKVILYDASGRTVQTLELSEGKNSVEISNIGAGMYILRDEHGGQVKLVVK